MKPSARAAFWGYSVKHEGYVETLYLDVLGLATVSVGNLVDPLSTALPLPWVHRNSGRPATRAEVTQEWLRVKSQACGVYGPDARICAWSGTGKVCFAHRGWKAAEKVCNLKLTEDGCRWLVDKKLSENVAVLRQRWPSWDEFPADAQLALAGWAWAVGVNARWPMLSRAVEAQDWSIAAIESKIRETGNPGVAPRNRDQRLMFLNAHRVKQDGLDPDLLFWPAVVEAPPTLRELPAAEDVGDFREDAAATLPARREMLGDAMVRRSSEELALDLEKLGEGD